MAFAATVLALALATPGAYAVMQGGGAVTGDSAATAARVARIILPEERLLTVRIPRFERAFAAEMKGDAEIDALERAMPGISTEIGRRARIEVTEVYRRVLATLHGDVAALYARQFTEAELTAVGRFFATPIGQRIVGLSLEATGDDATDMDADRRRRVAAALGNPSRADVNAMAALQAAVPSETMQTVNAAVAELSARRFDDVTNEMRRRMPAIVAAARATMETAK